MRDVLKTALMASAICAGSICAGSVAAVAAPITGELNLVGDGGVNFGGGTATMAVFSALGGGSVTAGNQTGSFSILAPCLACVTFGSAGSPAPAGDTQYTYGPLLSTSTTGGDTTYTHGPASGATFFTLLDAGVMASFTPDGDVTLDKLVSVVAGHTSTSFILNATGLLMLTGYDPTEGSFSITSQGANTFASFSATADAAPAPLAGAGLLSFGGAGLVGLRKRGRRLLGRLSSRRLASA